MRRPIFLYSLLLAAAAVLGLLLAWSGAGSQADFWAYDLFLRLRTPAARQSASIILAIDEESLNSLGGLLQLRPPLAEALEILSRHEPAAIAIDMVLSEPRIEEENRALEAALRNSRNVALACNLRAGSEPDDGSWEEPIESFRNHVAALGHVHAEPDADGICRRVLLAKAGGRTRRWAMALEAFRLARNAEAILETEAGLEIGGHFIPAPQREQRALRITFPNPERPVDRISLKQVLDDPQSAAAVKGRVVFVGVHVLGGLDRYLMTPYSYGQPMSGVEINASVYETLAGGRFLRTVPESTSLAFALAGALALGVCFWKLAGNRALLAAAAVLLAAHLVPLALFYRDQVMPFATAAFPAWLCFFAGGGYHYLAVRGKLSLAEAQRSRYQRAVHYVTHEMRTPLTAIQGSSELMSRYTLPEEKRKEIADLIHRESQRLARMVESFLSVERLSAGELELHRAAVLPREILGACIERSAHLAARKQIEIKQGECSEEPVWGDREFLEYACYNLLSNAIKYSPAKTSITVRARHEGDNVRISVEDHGYGMDEREIKNIFHKFYRTRRAQESGEAGTGLGLAIVEEIVVQHGGTVEVESAVNRGSRFTLSLPRATRRAMQTVAETPS